MDSLTPEQHATMLRRMFKSGAAHPPTLPECMAWATAQSGPVSTYVEPPNCSQFELAVNNWFLHRAVRGRFNGASHEDLARIRTRALEVSRMHTMVAAEGDPAMTNERLVGFLDAVADEHYPTEVSELWKAAHGVNYPQAFP